MSIRLSGCQPVRQRSIPSENYMKLLSPDAELEVPFQSTRGNQKRCILILEEGIVCDKLTHHFKDYCSEHVETSPYVQNLRALLSSREAQDQAILDDELTSEEILDTEVCKEILEFLRESDNTQDTSEGYLATKLVQEANIIVANAGVKEAQVALELVERCFVALWQEGVIELSRTKRQDHAGNGLIAKVKMKEAG